MAGCVKLLVILGFECIRFVPMSITELYNVAPDRVLGGRGQFRVSYILANNVSVVLSHRGCIKRGTDKVANDTIDRRVCSILV